jgi:phosphate:Na+ symporter
VERAVAALVNGDRTLAKDVVRDKKRLNRLASAAEEHLGRRLVADDPNRLAAFRIETDVIENLRRIYYFAKRIAKIVESVDMQYLRKKSDRDEAIEEVE